MYQLNNLVSLVKKRKRVGRGGKLGGTSGKGSKGQKARSGGYVRADFEGGQMPLTRRIPKRGFNNARFRDDIILVSIAALEKHFENGAQITKAILIEKGLIKKEGLLKILGGSVLSKKITVIADKFSKTAEQSIKDAGGEVRFIKES